jgi:SSS family transporter
MDQAIKSGMNMFGLTMPDGSPMNEGCFFCGNHILPEYVGYMVVLLFGAFFSLFTTLLVYIDYKLIGTKQTSEQFNTAGRSIKTGLTASVIVSQWTWAATLLQSSNVAYSYGISGPFWYASGATIQVLLFGILAVEVKRKAPTAHTFLEIIRARWGDGAHKVFLVFAFLTNIIVTSMLLLGGAAVVNALTGMNIYLASFLIPLGVILYTAAGGLKATFMASYIHTTIIMIALVIFVLQVYSINPLLGSIEKVYENLGAVATRTPVSGNLDGSYLTMISSGGLMFGIINIVGNFGTVFVDQSYWQSAIAAKPSSSHKGYLMGGLCWFCIPFSLATALGLACVAMDLPVNVVEAGQGLVPPATAVMLMGQPGAILMLTMLFMAVTSTGSAELIAVSSLVAYDIYRTYINPEATGRQIIEFSRKVIVAFGVFMGCLAVLLNWIGLSLGWVYLFMGVVIGSAVSPIFLSLTWSKTSAAAAISASILGAICAIAGWMLTAFFTTGSVTIDTLGGNVPMLVGNLIALGLSTVIVVLMSLANPDNCTWENTKAISVVEESSMPTIDEDGPDGDKAMEHAKSWILKWGIGFSLLMVVVWPIISIPAGVFSLSVFQFWVYLSIAWGMLATAYVVIAPITESVSTFSAVVVTEGKKGRNEAIVNGAVLERTVSKPGSVVTAV